MDSTAAGYRDTGAPRSCEQLRYEGKGHLSVRLRRRELFEGLTVANLFKKLVYVHGNQIFITTFKMADHEYSTMKSNITGN